MEHPPQRTARAAPARHHRTRIRAGPAQGPPAPADPAVPGHRLPADRAGPHRLLAARATQRRGAAYGRSGHGLLQVVVLAGRGGGGCQHVAGVPLVLASSPELFRWHKAWSPWYMTALQTLMLMVALRQFLVLDWRRDGWRLLLAGALFAALKWQATQLYARAVVELVLCQMGA